MVRISSGDSEPKVRVRSIVIVFVQWSELCAPNDMNDYVQENLQQQKI